MFHPLSFKGIKCPCVKQHTQPYIFFSTWMQMSSYVKLAARFASKTSYLFFPYPTTCNGQSLQPLHANVSLFWSSYLNVASVHTLWLPFEQNQCLYLDTLILSHYSPEQYTEHDSYYIIFSFISLNLFSNIIPDFKPISLSYEVLAERYTYTLTMNYLLFITLKKVYVFWKYPAQLIWSFEWVGWRSLHLACWLLEMVQVPVISVCSEMGKTLDHQLLAWLENTYSTRTFQEMHVSLATTSPDTTDQVTLPLCIHWLWVI